MPEYIEINAAREHAVQATRRRCMQQADQFMILYWEESWWVMSHHAAPEDDPMTLVPADKLLQVASMVRNHAPFGVIVYQIEALCVPRLTLP